MSDPAGRREAVALRYEAQAEAPRVVAKGMGAVADALVARAQAAGVPVREDAALVELLGLLDIDQLVPPALYAVVAEVLAWAYAVDGGEPPDARPPA